MEMASNGIPFSPIASHDDSMYNSHTYQSSNGNDSSIYFSAVDSDDSMDGNQTIVNENDENQQPLARKTPSRLPGNKSASLSKNTLQKEFYKQLRVNQVNPVVVGTPRNENNKRRSTNFIVTPTVTQQFMQMSISSPLGSRGPVLAELTVPSVPEVVESEPIQEAVEVLEVSDDIQDVPEVVSEAAPDENASQEVTEQPSEIPIVNKVEFKIDTKITVKKARLLDTRSSQNESKQSRMAAYVRRSTFHRKSVFNVRSTMQVTKQIISKAKQEGTGQVSITQDEAPTGTTSTSGISTVAAATGSNAAKPQQTGLLMPSMASTRFSYVHQPRPVQSTRFSTVASTSVRNQRRQTNFIQPVDPIKKRQTIAPEPPSGNGVFVKAPVDIANTATTSARVVTIAAPKKQTQVTKKPPMGPTKPKVTNIPKASGPSKVVKNVAVVEKPPQKSAETNKCSNCPRSFSTEFALKVHMSNFHNIGGGQTKKTNANGSLNSGAVNLQCKYCAKTFAIRFALDNHIREKCDRISPNEWKRLFGNPAAAADGKTMKSKSNVADA